MKIIEKSPRLGQFWDLQRRLRRSEVTRLQVVSCCELGFQVDQLFSPVRPTWFGQNAGGCICQIARESVRLDELVVVHHEGCHFHSQPCDSLHREWELLCRAVGEGQQSASLAVHLWALMGPEQSLQVYSPHQRRLQSPFS